MSKNESILKNSAVAITLAAICQILWGIVFPLIKKAYALFSINNVPSTFLFASIRFMVAGLILLAFASIRDKRLPILNKKEYRAVLFLGTMQTGICYAFQFAALTKASSINCSVINGAASLFAVLFARMLYPEEKLTTRKIAGILLGFAGVLFCFLYGGDGMSSFSLGGEGLMILSVMAFNFSASYSKKITGGIGVDSMITAGYNLLVGGVELFVLAMLFGGRLANGGVAGYGLLLSLALISSFCLLVWTALFSVNGVAKIAVFQGCNPVSGAIAASLLLGENVLQTKYIVAILLVTLGIVVINLQPKKN